MWVCINTRNSMPSSFKPDVYQRVEQRAKKDIEPQPVSEEEVEYLDTFKGRIQFLTFTFVKPTRDSFLSRIRVYTPRRNLRLNNIEDAFVFAFPQGFTIVPCAPYRLTNSFDVRVHPPQRMDQFILNITKALEQMI